ncbi:Probable RNA-directed DNA polymerase from transposon X-element [Eumeta japonica]|uniref:Probable RNA-directed DNA polymerase from transposon X-element n=1 Tax=Eumeta variegata TaxID=151549 RepID=A0A4C1ZBZ0_EUMVA|nr:Probable RNA-directed DNA polymerase from transposon X-element [Eumeta japonica]
MAWYALCPDQQRRRFQTQQNIVLRMITGAGWYVKNDIIARDLRVQTIEEFVRLHARRLFDCEDEGSILSLYNLAPQYEKPPGGYQLPRDLMSSKPQAHARTCSEAVAEDPTTTLMREKCNVHGHVPSIKIYATHICRQMPYINCSGFGASVTVVLRPPHMTLVL